MRKPFQKETVRWAVDRLRDPHGSRRVLVADEVGLGKTLVAQGVIEELAQNRPSDEPFRVFYLCSSLSIAFQNRTRLVEMLPEPQRKRALIEADRLSLLLERRPDTNDVPFHLFTLTPGTSLQEGTGIVDERVILARCTKAEFDFTAAQWFHDAFQGNATKGWRGRWDDSSVPDWYRGRLRDRFTKEVKRLFPRKEAWQDALPERVKGALQDESTRWSAVARLRTALILSVIDQIAPNLLIFDEFQRFFDVLPTDFGDSEGDEDEGGEEQALAIVRALLDGASDGGSSPAVLMMSATPYRMYARATEGNQHQEEFFRLVRFLHGEKGIAEWKALKDDFERYRTSLIREAIGSTVVLDAKAAIERRLRRVMARTERGALLGDIAPKPTIDPVPAPIRAKDIEGYVHLVASIEEMRYAAEPFWSSIPFPLQMMPRADYAFRRKANPAPLARNERSIRLRSDAIRRFDRIDYAHPRLRKLLEALPAEMLSLPWMPPSLPWWALEGPFKKALDAGEGTVSKALVFSRFRAVPRALSTILSYEAERTAVEGASRNGRHRYDYATRASHHHRAEGTAKGEDRRAGRDGLYPLPRPAFTLGHGREWCRLVAMFLPWKAAADLGNVLARAIESNGALTFEEAKGEVRCLLEKQLGIDDTRQQRTIPAWRWLVVLEAPEQRDMLEDALREWREAEPGTPMFEVGDLQGKPTGRELDELAEIAICGPGPMLVRCVERVFGPTKKEAERIGLLCKVLLDGFRPYLDAPEFHLLFAPSNDHQSDRRGEIRKAKRPDKRAALRRACWDGNLESVLDEFLCVEQGLGTTAPNPENDRGDDALASLHAALSLHDTRLDVDRLRRDAAPMRLRCHAAVPFGLRGNNESGSEAPRPDQLRKAFNTPFRPMALVTTSIGQEGLDFHRWARHLIHWDLPDNPVDLEQRDGRLNRYGSLAVRQTLALSIGELHPCRSPWHVVSERRAEAEDHHGLTPWWHVEHADIRRTLLVPPFSRLERDCASLQAALGLYRLALGQPDQEALVRRLWDRHVMGGSGSANLWQSWLRKAAIDLRPSSNGIRCVDDEH